MDIGRVNGTNHIKPAIKNKKAANAKSTANNSGDRVSISPEAKEMAELQKAVKFTSDTPDIRMDRVRDVKQKLADGHYDNDLSDIVASRIADRIINSLGL